MHSGLWKDSSAEATDSQPVSLFLCGILTFAFVCFGIQSTYIPFESELPHGVNFQVLFLFLFQLKSAHVYFLIFGSYGLILDALLEVQ